MNSKPESDFLKEILNISVNANNFDIKREIESKILVRLAKNERNNFNFYNIPQDVYSFTKTKRKFNSIHFLVSSNTEQKKFLQKATQLTNFENSLLKKKTKPLFLGEIYDKLDEVKECDAFTDNEYNLKYVDEFSQNFKNKHHRKTKSEFKNSNLPILTKNFTFEKKYAPNKTIVLKEMGDLIYKDNDLKLSLLKYLRFDKNSHENEIEENEEMPNNSIHKMIQSFFQTFKEENSLTLVEKIIYFQKSRTNIENIFDLKTRNAEAILNNKSILSNYLRRENSKLLNNMGEIKSQLNKLKQALKDFSSLHEKNTVIKRNDMNLKIVVNESQTKTIQNYKNSPDDKKSYNSKKNASSKNFHKETSLSEDSVRFLEKTNETRKKEEEENNLKRKYQNFQNKLDANKHQLIQIDEEIKKERKNLKFHKETRETFYLDLLKIGLDCGLDEGISWILRKIQKLGISLKNIVFPSFLDEKAKEFLLEKNMILQSIHENETMQQITREHLTERPIFSNKNDEEANERSSINFIDNNRKEMLELQKSLTNTSENERLLKEVKLKIKNEILPSSTKISNNSDLSTSRLLFSSNWNFCVENSLNVYHNDKSLYDFFSKHDYIKEYSNLKSKIDILSQELHRKEKKEIERIIKEFDFKQYAFRFNTDCEIVLSALIGAKKANLELIRNGMRSKKMTTEA